MLLRLLQIHVDATNTTTEQKSMNILENISNIKYDQKGLCKEFVCKNIYNFLGSYFLLKTWWRPK